MKRAHVFACIFLLSSCAVSDRSVVLPDSLNEAQLPWPLYNAILHEETGLWMQETRVFGGKDAEDGQFPYQVALVAGVYREPNRLVVCSGSLIDSNWVLTAAHCVDRNLDPRRIDVVEGATDIRASGRRIAVAEIIVHRGWPLNAPRNQITGDDIALLRLREPARSRPISYVQAAAANVADNAPLLLSGWGRTETNGSPRRLQYAAVNVVAYSDCSDRTTYGTAIKTTMLCAGAAQADACSGDSGGPLASGAGGDALLVGIVSYAPLNCNHADLPAVYTRVSSYRGWIEACINQAAACLRS